MNFTPSTIVKVLRGVNIDATYRDTYTFADESAQIEFFTKKKKYDFTDFAYQRHSNSLKLPVNAELLFDCDYIMFRNESIRNKWFYAFITKVEFINQNVSEVFFEVDVMQTWYFDYIMMPSFVEREHVEDDTFGLNLVDENLETGEYIVNSGVVDQPETIAEFTPYIIVGVAELLPEYKPQSTADIIDHSFTGLKYYYCSLVLAERVTELVKKYSEAGKGDAIVTVFMFPSQLMGIDKVSGSGWLTDEQLQPIIGGNIKNLFAPLDGYAPKNNKLFTYPYRALEITTGTTAKMYNYEFFRNFNNMFTVIGTPSPAANILAVPNDYKGFNLNLDENVTMQPFPQCSWINDTYANWLAQNQMSNTLSLSIGAGKIAAGVLGAATGAVTIGTATAISGANDVLGVLTKIANHSVIPDSAKGSTASANTFYANGQWYFYLVPKCIRREYAERIDNFFSVYGYKVANVKVPNINSRKSWNYLKTINAALVGSIPSDELAKIREVYNKGITFWHGDFVGDYNHENTII